RWLYMLRSHDLCRTHLNHHLTDSGGASVIEALNRSAPEGHLVRVESLAVPGLARIDGRGCVRKADEDDTPTAEIQQMLGDHVTRTAIVDAHQIMLRVLGVGHDRTIEQHDRDPCLVERAPDAAMHLVRG